MRDLYNGYQLNTFEMIDYTRRNKADFNKYINKKEKIY